MTELKSVTDAITAASLELEALFAEAETSLMSSEKLHQLVQKVSKLAEGWFTGYAPGGTLSHLPASVADVPTQVKKSLSLECSTPLTVASKEMTGIVMTLERLLSRARLPVEKRLINQRTADAIEEQAVRFTSICGFTSNYLLFQICERLREIQHALERHSIEAKLKEHFEKLSHELEIQGLTMRTEMASSEAAEREAIATRLIAARKKLKKKKRSALTTAAKAEEEKSSALHSNSLLMLWEQADFLALEEDEREQMDYDADFEFNAIWRLHEDAVYNSHGRIAQEKVATIIRIPNLLCCPLPVHVASVNGPNATSEMGESHWKVQKLDSNRVVHLVSVLNNRWTLQLSIDTLEIFAVFFHLDFLSSDLAQNQPIDDDEEITLQRLVKHSRTSDLVFRFLIPIDVDVCQMRQLNRGGRGRVESDTVPFLPSQIDVHRVPKRMNEFIGHPFVAVLLAHGGYFTGAIFDAVGNVVAHKSRNRYVTRRGQGGRQSAHQGRTDTAGSQIRAHHEKKWISETREVIAHWCCFEMSQMNHVDALTAKIQVGCDESLEELHQILAKAYPNQQSLLGLCSRIYVHAPGSTNQGMILHRNALDGVGLPFSKFVPLQSTDGFSPKLRKVSITTGRPSQNEAKNVFMALMGGLLVEELSTGE